MFLFLLISIIRFSSVTEMHLSNAFLKKSYSQPTSLPSFSNFWNYLYQIRINCSSKFSRIHLKSHLGPEVWEGRPSLFTFWNADPFICLWRELACGLSSSLYCLAWRALAFLFSALTSWAVRINLLIASLISPPLSYTDFGILYLHPLLNPVSRCTSWPFKKNFCVRTWAFIPGRRQSTWVNPD